MRNCLFRNALMHGALMRRSFFSGSSFEGVDLANKVGATAAATATAAVAVAITTTRCSPVLIAAAICQTIEACEFLDGPRLFGDVCNRMKAGLGAENPGVDEAHIQELLIKRVNRLRQLDEPR